MGERLWWLRFIIDVREYLPNDSIFVNESNDLHFCAAKLTKQWINFIETTNKLPSSPSAGDVDIKVLPTSSRSSLPKAP